MYGVNDSTLTTYTIWSRSWSDATGGASFTIREYAARRTEPRIEVPVQSRNRVERALRRLEEAIGEFKRLAEMRLKQLRQWTQAAIAERRELLLTKPRAPRLRYMRPLHVARVVALDDRYRVMLC